MQSPIELRIKAISLMDEARTIRREEHKVSGSDRYSLQQHRKTIVRWEARATHLARGYLTGMPLQALERKWKHPGQFWTHIYPPLERMVKKYGSGELATDLRDWTNPVDQAA